MRPLSRRRALQLGGFGVAGVVFGGAGLAWAGATDHQPATGETLVEPAVLASTAGSLNVTLEAAPGLVRIAGREATTLHYNGGAPGPTLYVRPGDHLGVTLANHLAEPTNLHTHGLQVSPQGNSDNPFVMVDPGGTFQYDYQIPTDHPPGTFCITRTTTDRPPIRCMPGSTGQSSSQNPARRRSRSIGCW